MSDMFALLRPGVPARPGRARVGDTVKRQSPAENQQAVDAAYAKFRTLNEGKNADYIRRSQGHPNLFGIALITADGKVYTAGDVKTEVSIESIPKVFTMAQVIQDTRGCDRTTHRRRCHRRTVQLDHRG